jgi:nucleoside phosphorylase
MPNKSVAIIAAMPVELAPLIGHVQPQIVNGVDLFDLPRSVVAIGGIGEKFARRAAEVAVDFAQPRLLLSAGIVGAISPKLKVGDVARIREVIDVATGIRYTTTGGDWVLATSQDVSDSDEKNGLLTKFGADVVDMEAAAVAQAALDHGLPFASIKAISDDAEFAMPPMNRFIGADGKFETHRFLMYIALHPRWWTTLGRIKANSELASKNLCEAVEHLLESGQWSVASG